MTVYQRQTHVRAPLDEVWEFYSSVDGLVALTPEWMRLRVESVDGPDGEPNPEVLEAGSEVRLSVRPFGVLPRQRWVSRIVERRHDGDAALFRDDMVEGPFPKWEHAHAFYANGDGTLLRDRVDYELPVGPAKRIVGPLATIGLDPMFRHRHRRTKELLEGRRIDVEEGREADLGSRGPD